MWPLVIPAAYVVLVGLPATVQMVRLACGRRHQGTGLMGDIADAWRFLLSPFVKRWTQNARTR
jgi:hypothetical protein